MTGNGLRWWLFLLREEKAAREARTSKADQAWCRDRGKVLRLDRSACEGQVRPSCFQVMKVRSPTAHRTLEVKSSGSLGLPFSLGQASDTLVPSWRDDRFILELILTTSLPPVIPSSTTILGPKQRSSLWLASGAARVAGAWEARI